MKKIYSLIVCGILSLVFIQYRLAYTDSDAKQSLMVTTWDALGYYYYLPAVFIYDDVRQLEWMSEIEQEYQVSGGAFYQARQHSNGNYVGKYLTGVAIMQAPFFFVGHLIAQNTAYKADGFSAPYQYAIAFGALMYAIIGLFLLRAILLFFFSDAAVALGLLLLGLATNLIQYVSIKSGMSHAYIFVLYALILYCTLKWHERPKFGWAFLGGWIMGMATICRPTEAIILFIPLLWNTHTKTASRQKWMQVKKHQTHLIYAVLGGLIGILPQLIYWKMVTGDWIYNVGSKWYFLSPYFRVLFGFENGWFIYTPITIFFVLGFWFIKTQPFKNAVLIFCLLNIWIIIAWSDWKYGGTYSTRALVQSYPVFALPFTAIIEKILNAKWRYAFYGLALYLVGVNLFQLYQYNETILHYRDMNRLYYGRIYLNSNPSPLDMSLLDTDEILDNETDYKRQELVALNMPFLANSNALQTILNETTFQATTSEQWLKITASIKSTQAWWGSYLSAQILGKENSKLSKVRLFSPISKAEAINNYAFFIKVPSSYSGTTPLKVIIESPSPWAGKVEALSIHILTKK